MKVEVITRHAIANYGSLLQAIATQNVVNNLGYECEILDFIRDDEFGVNSTVTIAKTKNRINKNPILFFLYCLVRFPESFIINSKFAKMRNKYLNMSKLYHSLEELANNKPQADIYLTGSDQVWGPVLYGGYEWAYFLKFCDEEDKKVAYGASFGKTRISDCDKKEMVKNLKRYDQIIVREKQAKEMLRDWGIQSEQCLDPTLLLDKEAWKRVIPFGQIKNQSKYVLVYQIHSNDRLSRYAKMVAKQMGLPLIRISAMLHQCFKGGKFVAVPNVSEFLAYIDNAAYIVTDSFHGTAFAINFNIPFVTMMPETGTSSRNMSLLELTNLTSQIAFNENDLAVLEKSVDFSKANQILTSERRRSINLLKRMLT